jgi:hypothetical protein
MSFAGSPLTGRDPTLDLALIFSFYLPPPLLYTGISFLALICDTRCLE